jgi:hypothetical protein
LRTLLAGLPRRPIATRPIAARPITGLALARLPAALLSRLSATWAFSATLVERIARCRREHPALADARHRPALFALLFGRALGAGLGRLGQALEAHRLARLESAGPTAIAAASTATTATTPATSTIAIAAFSTVSSPTAATLFARLATGLRLEVDQIVELADLLRASRLVGAGEHAHQAHALGLAADGLERFDQPRQAIAAHVELGAETLGQLLGRDALAGQFRARLGRALDGESAELCHCPHGGADASMPPWIPQS